MLLFILFIYVHYTICVSFNVNVLVQIIVFVPDK